MSIRRDLHKGSTFFLQAQREAKCDEWARVITH